MLEYARKLSEHNDVGLVRKNGELRVYALTNQSERNAGLTHKVYISPMPSEVCAYVRVTRKYFEKNYDLVATPEEFRELHMGGAP